MGITWRAVDRLRPKSVAATVARRAGAKGPSVVEFGPDDLGQAPYWAERNLQIRISLPPSLLTLQGAFAYADGWNPLVEAVKGGPKVLQDFYGRHRPENIGSMYYLTTSGEAGTELPPWELPWLFRQHRLPPPGENGLGPEHGLSYLGPCTADKVAVEDRRLNEVRNSIQKVGYQPDRYGDIGGFVLRRGREYRFFVRSGKHRAAILAAEGWTSIPVTFREYLPRVIDVADIDQWPLVKSGSMDRSIACRIFDRYFDFDGSQQHALMNRAMAEYR